MDRIARPPRSRTYILMVKVIGQNAGSRPKLMGDYSTPSAHVRGDREVFLFLVKAEKLYAP